MKKKLEYQKNGAYYETTVELRQSRLNNAFFKHEGNIYIVTDMRNGSDVLLKNGFGKWQKVGRVTWNSIFLGEGETYSEHNDRIFREEKHLPMVVMP